MGDAQPRHSPLACYTPAFACSLALHGVVVAAAAGWLIRIPSGSPPSKPRLRDRAVTVFVVAPEDSRFPGLNPVDAALDVEGMPATVSAGGFTFDAAKIARRAHVLFPFLTPGIALEHFGARPVLSAAAGLENPFAAADAPKEDAAVRPLAVDDAALQRLVDRSWSRRERWTAFQSIVEIAGAHSGSDGRLPVLLQRYCDQNALQPYTDATVRDPRLWAQLGIAADHVDFIGFIRRYASEHPSTRATTALLFLLDSMARASQDALETLLERDPVGDLAWTRDADPRARDLLTRLRSHYRGELDRRGLTTLDAMTVFHESVRLSILAEILRQTPDGYRASDARFLTGAICWRQRRFGDALRSWRAMTVDPADSHVAAYSQILKTLDRASGRSDADAADAESSLNRDLRQILKNEQGRWLMFSFDRLRQFGYSFDTF